jgi:hypothetical protein
MGDSTSTRPDGEGGGPTREELAEAVRALVAGLGGLRAVIGVYLDHGERVLAWLERPDAA